ncbi:MAG: hypothetical protein ACRDHW_16555, partial [Ktedonobacteraceae bacterium]
MLDTLMVLFIRSARSPLGRVLIALLFVCAGIGALLLLITLSGVKWPGIAATASSVPDTSHGPVFAPTPIDPSIPIILQNPCAA